ncbi:hypothetical protein TBLA_0B02890 [Henningerozyma blattae CBS 6284]|uniref:ATP-dependent DNA helicase II subunit 1 n=1 Tax=Henningerozyma blattae (strain ATCC 34711 / CBS 6284 / DSM 70876 / NBRC 10599 / NRRL Y-10934 / UCD 77-7) TaxID=1071380 RepID=I2GYC9_HENB6|nr:hypothetical protein TBLA_0B02890 [Tetrapisispora blattae CBS 6284]CCH59131.1 hypothetical protein TBLA_0B02890 [Tetrapisispora blattae CBS 6284]
MSFFSNNSNHLMDDNDASRNASYKKFHIHEGIIFCVELSSEMFENLPELKGKSQLLEILESLSDLFEQLIISRPNTAIGFYLFHHTSDSVEKNKFGIYEFFQLSDINVKTMKKVTDLLEDLSHDRKKLEDIFKFDNSRPTKLEDIFNVVQEQFLNFDSLHHSKGFNIKKVFLFTNNDKPIESENNETRKKLRRMVNDLNESEIFFSTFFINKPDSQFDDTFYSDILKLPINDDTSEIDVEDYYDDAGENGNHYLLINDLKDTSKSKTTDRKINPSLRRFCRPNTKPIEASNIKQRILRKQEIRRVRFQCPLILDEASNFIIGITGYNIFSIEKPGTRYKLVYEHENVRKEAFSRRKFLDPNTGEELKDEDFQKVYKYGDINIELSDEATQNIKNEYMENRPFMKLLGFRSKDISLKYYNNIDKASFVVPDESSYEGSIKTMASLFRTLHKKKKVAIVWGVSSSGGHPTIHILSPSNENEHNEGLYLFQVPFLDEIRRFPALTSYSPGTNKNISEYEKMKKLTEYILGTLDLRKGYRPSSYRNPALQKYYKILHDYLLQIEDTSLTDTPQEVLEREVYEDDTLYRLDKLRKRIIQSSQAPELYNQRLSKFIEHWNRVFKKINEDAQMDIEPTPVTLKKRKQKEKLALNL